MPTGAIQPPRTSPEHSLTWLHLSDLHLRRRDDWDSRTITEALIRDLKQLQAEYDLRPDLIFFTGDAAFGAAPGDTMTDQYQQVRKFFDAVRQCFTPEVPLRDLYVVPGNHDVDRAEITPGEMAWLRDRSRTLSDITSAMRDTTKQWRTWMDRLGHYRTFLTTCGLLHLEPENPHLIWADAREIAGIRVGIAGLNSAWSCADDLDKGRLWCGAEWQIAHVQQRMGPVAMSFALIHHPGNWFTDREDPRVMRRLRQEFPVVLHGHEHQDWIDIDSDGRLVVSAGACYECSWMENGYSFGRIDVRDRSGQVWLRRWDDTGRGWVAREVASKTRHGIWTLPVLSWLPAAGENAPAAEGRTTAAPSSDPDEPRAPELTVEDHYTQRYCRHVVDQYDVLELFGCDIPRELQRHQLSVAYVSLNLASEEDETSSSDDASSDGAPAMMSAEESERERASGARGQDARVEKDAGASSASIEYVLDNVSHRTNRLMILGPAGAGKSTLVRWCAIAAAQRTLNPPVPGADDLHAGMNVGMKRIMLDARYSLEKPGSEGVCETWREKIPFLIRLRDCSDGKLPAAADLQRFVAKQLPTAPPQWIVQVLDGGHALILFDGVDEVHRDKRAQLAEEIGEMIRTYPRCTYVVTTRPGAVERGWLERMQFVEARVEPMGRTDREEFVDKWYRSAALELRKRPRPNEDLSATAARLKNELTDQPELGTLASNPLLCAMICALYRERQEHLPETPAELSEALVHMLLHRRERETPGLQDAHFPATWRALQYSQKKGLLAELAWRMVSEEESSTTLKAAESVLGGVLASTPGRVSDEAGELLQAVIERSGLLKPAGDDQIDFLHNTLKEYLAAGRAVEAADWKTLAGHADDPAWQPLILFSLALAPETFSSNLVGELLARAAASSSSQKPSRRKKDRMVLKTTNARELFLVRCRGVAKRLAPELSKQIDLLTANLFPPANMQEVEALAPLGARILAYAGPRLMDPNWWARQNARTIYRCLRLLRLIGGRKASDALAAIKRLPGYSSLVIHEWMAARDELTEGALPP